MLSYLSYFIGPVGQWALFFLITFPATFLLTHIFLKKKYISLFKKVGVYLFVCFLFLALWLVLFPFPDFSDGFCDVRAGIQIWQLTPFQFIQDITTFADKYQVSLLRNKALFQVIFNIFLIFPIGFLGSLFFKWSFWKMLVMWFLISLGFEVIQGTGMFGMIPCPYRLFDVDDLMLNTFGVALWFLTISPFRQSLQDYFEQKDFVVKRENFLIRRALAFALDFMLMGILFGMLALLWNIGVHNSHEFVQMFSFLDADLLKIVGDFVQLFLYFVVLCYFLKWQTLGKKMLKMKIISTIWKKLSFWQIVIRSIIPVFSFTVINLWGYIVYQKTGIILEQNGIYALVYFVYLLIFIPLSIELSTDGRALHDRMWGTKVIKIKSPDR